MARIVIALGGNALGNNAEEQQKKIDEACPALVGLISQGHEIVITHGNGPQVGMINRAFDLASQNSNQILPMELQECTAMSQGYIGYHLQKGIKKELHRQNMPWNVASVITQVLVDTSDSAFDNPTKPIGSFYTKEKAEALMKECPQIKFKEDAGRGYRRVVASPNPVEIIERDLILNLLDNSHIVIACGGGGIPVIRDKNGDYQGIPAVIDKDFAAALLAKEVNADYLFILTAVDRVCINFGKPDQRELTEMSVEQAEKYIKENQFAPGSMLPKVEAALRFVRSDSKKRAIIASLENSPLAMRGESGTLITT